MPARPRLFARPDRVVYRSPDVRVGTFHCPTEHPEFRTAGPIEGYTVVFPRSAVWIRHAGRAPFVADPSVAVIYNQGQAYVRHPLAPDGDRADWFSLSRALAAEIMRDIDAGAATDGERPFPVAFGPANAALYYRQRLLFSRLVQGGLHPLEVEQEVLMIVGLALERAVGRSSDARRCEGREVVQRARAELARNPAERPTIRQLAGRLDVSPFHLCRVFRRTTGLTLHHYLLELRTRVALERFEEGAGSLSRLALELGFSSHSHFTAEFRRRLGVAPSRVRRVLQSQGRPAGETGPPGVAAGLRARAGRR